MQFTGTSIDELAVKEAFEHARHWLPSQGSLHTFVHHNTLHAFEDLPFFSALQTAAGIYGANCLLTEPAYRDEMNRERIGWDLVDEVLRRDLGDDATRPVANLGTLFELRSTMVRHQIHSGGAHELRWLMQESAAEQRFRSDLAEELAQTMLTATRRRLLTAEHDLAIGLERTKSRVDRYLNDHPLPARQSWSDREWEACSLKLLWIATEQGVRSVALKDSRESEEIRLPRLLSRIVDDDVEQCVNEVMIRFTSSFVDQGYAHGALPVRQVGFLASFVNLYESAWLPPHPLLKGLSRVLAGLKQEKLTPLQVILRCFEWLELQSSEIEPYLQATLLELPGWGGMLQQLETRPDRVAQGVPAETLLEFVAVRLILEQVACREALRRAGSSTTVSELRQIDRRTGEPDRYAHLALAYAVYQIAQLRGWLPETMLALDSRRWTELVVEVQSFDVFQRCRLFQLVIEAAYRQRLMNGLQDRGAVTRPAPLTPLESPRPSFQWIGCIDDREESLRRYLEEQDPACRTYGYAGFFAVPMYFKGLADAHYTPLCPIVIQPENYVCEVTSDAEQNRLRQRRRWRRWLAAHVHWVHNRSRGVAGGIGLGMLGILSTAPLVLRVLFPRFTSLLRRQAASLLAYPTATQLTLDRTEAAVGDAPSHGLEPQVQVESVKRLLQDIGLLDHHARLIVVCGHGSASLNNPHESAYNCGACGGGRGGPNARAFCQLANRPAVREQLRQAGIRIPDDTYFLGVFHNTCDDTLQYFDLEKVPSTHQLDVQQFQQTMAAALGANAQERCRRFESAPWGLGPQAALRHVHERAEDLSQTRPEYNHATNAACVVGRRERTRGLFLDRRVFLPSYDPTVDNSQHEILQRILGAVVPVCAGINLEYFFSRVDPAVFGCGSKLPHNVTSLLGVMDGPASDLRTGLSEQMVEIHQPLRLLLVVETEPDVLRELLRANPQLARLCFNGWVQVATLSPDSTEIHLLDGQQFLPYQRAVGQTPSAASSQAWYRGSRDHLEPALVGEIQ